jgi:hypothetical protein
MTGFLLAASVAVDTALAAICETLPGETYPPREVPARLLDRSTR